MTESQKPLIYLNNAATSWPKPPGVIKAIEESLSLPVSGSGRTSKSQGKDCVTLARERVCTFLGADSPENIVFTHNATDSLNILISGFIAKEKDRFHVLATELDHNSVLRPLYEYEKKKRISLSVVPFEDCNVTPESVEEAIRPDTKLMVMTHGSNVLGSVQNIRETGEILKEKGVFFIADGAQTAGHIPVNLTDLPVDAFVFTGHKGLLGVTGTGGFYISDPKRVEPVRFGGTGTNSVSLFQPEEMPERFETGTHNYTGLCALAAGIDFIEEKGIANIEKKARAQTAFIIRELKREKNIKIYNEEPDLAVIAFNINGLENDDAGFILSRAYNIIARTGLHCAPLVHKAIDGGEGCVRISLSCFTTDEECKTAADAIREIAENADSKIS